MKRILLTFCMAFACLAGAVADELIAFPGEGRICAPLFFVIPSVCEESPKYPVMLSNSEASHPQRFYPRGFSLCSYFLGRRFFLPMVVRMTVVSFRAYARFLSAYHSE